MKTILFKNTLFNIAAGVLAFSAYHYFNLSLTTTFGLCATAALGFIAMYDYRPRPKLQVKVPASKPVARTYTRRRVSALVAA